MNKLLLLLLVGVAITAMTIPFIPGDDGLERVKLREFSDRVVLVGRDGQIEFPLPDTVVYSPNNPYDFFPELIDPASLQKLEFLPYGKSVSCNALNQQGKRIAGNYHFCLVLAMKLDVPLYVHKDIFKSPKFSLPKNLRV